MVEVAVTAEVAPVQPTESDMASADTAVDTEVATVQEKAAVTVAVALMVGMAVAVVIMEYRCRRPMSASRRATSPTAFPATWFATARVCRICVL